MIRKKAEGKCHICGYIGKLSFEHVPPAKAFNEHKAYIYQGTEILRNKVDRLPWDLTHLKREQSQRGFGFYTLCGRCNNNTGNWYAGAFIEFMYQGLEILKVEYGKKIINCNFRNIYPLKIIKQIITMFFSANSPEFADKQYDLKAFVLSKEKRYLDPNKYGLYIYFLTPGGLSKFLGLSGILNLENKSLRIVSEIDTPPFGFVLDIKPKPEIMKDFNFINIIGIANEYEYTDKLDIFLKIPLLEINTYLPLDYRTKDEIIINRLRNLIHEYRNDNFKN
jgi:hypothetical protein